MRAIPPAALKIIDQWLRVKTLRGETLGCQISVRAGEKLVMSKAYGKATRTKRYTTKTLGRVASQSKTLTAVIALWLEEQKLLNLNQKIHEFVPELDGAKDKRISGIRLVDLLMHRSGLHRDSYLRDYWVKNEKLSADEKLWRSH
jgi:D-alanyl-D-alanine carboxypeptidase